MKGIVFLCLLLAVLAVVSCKPPRRTPPQPVPAGVQPQWPDAPRSPTGSQSVADATQGGPAAHVRQILDRRDPGQNPTGGAASNQPRTLVDEIQQHIHSATDPNRREQVLNQIVSQMRRDDSGPEVNENGEKRRALQNGPLYSSKGKPEVRPDHLKRRSRSTQEKASYMNQEGPEVFKTLEAGRSLLEKRRAASKRLQQQLK